ncbi:MAG: SRPBCC family protein, partial [Ktedonobacterales bacterium]
MLTIEAQTNIRRPVHEVFAFLADFTHMPLWNYYINSVTQVSPGPLGMGTVFDQ